MWNVSRWGLPPQIKESKKADRVRGHLRGLAKLVGGDNVYNLSRILRVPGTYNRKRGNRTRCSVVSVTGKKYRLEQLPYDGPKEKGTKKRQGTRKAVLNPMLQKL